MEHMLDNHEIEDEKISIAIMSSFVILIMILEYKYDKLKTINPISK